MREGEQRLTFREELSIWLNENHKAIWTCFFLCVISFGFGRNIESGEDHCVYWKEFEIGPSSYQRCTKTLSEIYKDQGFVFKREPFIVWSSRDDNY